MRNNPIVFDPSERGRQQQLLRFGLLFFILLIILNGESSFKTRTTNFNKNRGDGVNTSLRPPDSNFTEILPLKESLGRASVLNVSGSYSGKISGGDIPETSTKSQMSYSLVLEGIELSQDIKGLVYVFGHLKFTSNSHSQDINKEIARMSIIPLQGEGT
jgi:hypothetical protein